MGRKVLDMDWKVGTLLLEFQKWEIKYQSNPLTLFPYLDSDLQAPSDSSQLYHVASNYLQFSIYSGWLHNVLSKPGQL